MKSSILITAATTISCANAFVTPPSRTPTQTSLNMGLFDGVKEAFGADGSADGMGELGEARETPIDRWMGWNSKKDGDAPAASVSKGTSYFTMSSPCISCSI